MLERPRENEDFWKRRIYHTINKGEFYLQTEKFKGENPKIIEPEYIQPKKGFAKLMDRVKQGFSRLLNRKR
jgi:hypothetical protein